MNERGQPTPVVECLIRPPESRMGPLTTSEINAIMGSSVLLERYSKIEAAPQAATVLSHEKNSLPKKTAKAKGKKDAPSVITTLSKNTLVRQLVRQFFREITNAILRAVRLKK